MNLNFWSKFYIWLGWIGGSILQDRPWGKPTLKSWITWSNLYALVTACIQILFFLDVVLAYSKRHRQKVSDLSGVHSILTHLLFSFTSSVMILERCYLWVNAKRVVRFTNLLESHQWFAYGNGDKCSVSWRFHAFMALLFFLRMAATVLFEIKLATEEILENIWFGMFNYWVMVVISFLVVFLIFVIAFTGVGLITVRIRELLIILESLCDQLECSYQEISLIKVDPDCIVKNLEQKNKVWEFSKQRLIRRVEAVKFLFQEFDRLYGPLLLLLVIVEFISVLNGVNAILSTTDTPLGMIGFGISAISEFLMVFLFIEQGQELHDRVSISVFITGLLNTAF